MGFRLQSVFDSWIGSAENHISHEVGYIRLPQDAIRPD